VVARPKEGELIDLGIKDRKAAVAAASGGLGFAAAAALAAEGVQVAICGRSESHLKAAIDRIDGHVIPLVADVGTADGAAGFVRSACEALGQVDILVANAGGPPVGTFASTPVDGYVQALRLNLLSVVEMCMVAVPEMQSRGWGRVIAVTSMGARQPIPGMIASNTARAGVTGFLKTLAGEIAGDGVTVNSLLPGTHATDRIRSMFGDDLSGLAANIPVARVGVPADFGAVVAFLSSEAAGYITGSSIPVDGGACLGLL
jgi:3-oxoacyl-[acyl-carrier protein] reductase